MDLAAALATIEPDSLRFATRCEQYLSHAAHHGVPREEASAMLQQRLSSGIDTDRAFAAAREAVLDYAYPVTASRSGPATARHR